MRIIITGPNDFDDEFLLFTKMDKITKGLKNVVVVTGQECVFGRYGRDVYHGVNPLAHRWATKRHHPIAVKFLADRSTYNYQRNLIKRNSDMVNDADACVIFTRKQKMVHIIDLIEKAEEDELKLRVIYYH